VLAVVAQEITLRISAFRRPVIAAGEG